MQWHYSVYIQEQRKEIFYLENMLHTCTCVVFVKAYVVTLTYSVLFKVILNVF